MFPLIALGLGMLAGNQWLGSQLQSAQRQKVADQYAGLLGAAPGPMGPPDEQGNMGYSGGWGLLADPTDINRQLQFAAGVASLPGQQVPGVNLLNAGFARAQQQAEQAQQQRQWEQTFQRGGEQFAQGQQNWEKTYEAGRADAQAAADRFLQELRQRSAYYQQQAEQWSKDFGLKQAEFDWNKQQAGKAGGGLPQLPTGYGYAIGPDGRPIAAPVEGTPDYVKAKQGAATLQGAVDNIGEMLDMIEGKEVVTPQGKKVRIGGMGTEPTGPMAAKYSVLRGNIIQAMGKLQEMGVLQKDEYDRISNGIPDPSSWGSYFTKNRTMGAGFEEAGKLFQQKLDQHYESNPWLTPPVPAGFVPAPGGGPNAPAPPVGASGILTGIPQAAPKGGRGGLVRVR